MICCGLAPHRMLGVLQLRFLGRQGNTTQQKDNATHNNTFIAVIFLHSIYPDSATIVQHTIYVHPFCIMTTNH